MENPDSLPKSERKRILAKYDQAWTARAARDIGFEADLAMCRVTDHLGFLHDQEFPTLNPKESKERLWELKQVGKWLKMMNNWKKYGASSKMRRRIYKGVPPQVRGQVWALLLDMEEMKVNNPGRYERLKEQGRLLSPHMEQIDLDVNCTFRDHVFFRDRYSIKQRALFHVLLAYSMYNTEVGYCHGLNQVAALLLMFLDEEDAFWTLTQLLGDWKHAMHGYFIPGSPKLLRMQALLDLVLHKLLPKLWKHLDQEQMTTALYTNTWFPQGFLHQVPFAIALRFWDVFILDGETVMTAMALTVFKIHQRHLLQLPLDNLQSFLTEHVTQSWELREDEVVRHLQATMAQLRKHKLYPPPPPPGNTDEEPEALTPRSLLTLDKRHGPSTKTQQDLPGPPDQLECYHWGEPVHDPRKCFACILSSAPPFPPVIRNCFSSGHLDTWGAKKKTRRDRAMSLRVRRARSEPRLFRGPTIPWVSFTRLTTVQRHDHLQRASSMRVWPSWTTPPRPGMPSLLFFVFFALCFLLFYFRHTHSMDPMASRAPCSMCRAASTP